MRGRSYDYNGRQKKSDALLTKWSKRKRNPHTKKYGGKHIHFSHFPVGYQVRSIRPQLPLHEYDSADQKSHHLPMDTLGHSLQCGKAVVNSVPSFQDDIVLRIENVVHVYFEYYTRHQVVGFAVSYIVAK